MHNAKTDRNQKDIVDALRKAGCSVQCLSTVGKGFPDLLIGFSGNNYLTEIKDGLKSDLNPDQVKWHREWKGQVTTIHNMDELRRYFPGLIFPEEQQ
jgi:Holliday junction resolvase